MAKIRFTLGGSDVWHEIQIDYELSRQVLRDEHELAYLIKREQDRCGTSKAKSVEVYDDDGILLAKSPDILDWYKLEYYDKKNDENV